jgi:spore coat polysaccharide biosynthesis predicted glycosyltransferase SpsG
LEWALLRKPFIEASIKNKNKKHHDTIENVVVSFGGVDQYRLTDKFITMLAANNTVERIDAIVGEKYIEQVNKTDAKKVFFHRSISAQKVANLFSNCDLAVLSASTICIEALACGARVAAGYYVKNQKEGYEYLKYNHFIHGLGLLLKLQSLNLQYIDFQAKNILPIQNVTKSYITYFNTLI